VTGVSVLCLDQEPGWLALLATTAHQMPAALEARAKQLEAQMSFQQLRLGIALRAPHAGVELIHMALAVAVRDLAFEAGIGHGMVFHLHRQPLHCGVVTWTFGHGPASQHVTDLQPKIEMAAAGMVQLHHEDRALARVCLAAAVWLAGLAEVPLAFVLAQFAHVGSLPAPARGRPGFNWWDRPSPARRRRRYSWRMMGRPGTHRPEPAPPAALVAPSRWICRTSGFAQASGRQG